MTEAELNELMSRAEPVTLLPFRPDWEPGLHNEVYYDEKFECWQLTTGSWAPRTFDDEGHTWPSVCAPTPARGRVVPSTGASLSADELYIIASLTDEGKIAHYLVCEGWDEFETSWAALEPHWPNLTGMHPEFFEECSPE